VIRPLREQRPGQTNTKVLCAQPHGRWLRGELSHTFFVFLRRLHRPSRREIQTRQPVQFNYPTSHKGPTPGGSHEL